jgi:hypothetical protein
MGTFVGRELGFGESSSLRTGEGTKYTEVLLDHWGYPSKAGGGRPHHKLMLKNLIHRITMLSPVEGHENGHFLSHWSRSVHNEMRYVMRLHSQNQNFAASRSLSGVGNKVEKSHLRIFGASLCQLQYLTGFILPKQSLQS